MSRTKIDKRSWLSLALSLALVSGASEGWAQGPLAGAPAAATVPSLGESLSGEAKADYDSAKILYNDRDYAGALVKFTAAHAKSSDPRLLWNMAACEKSLRHYARALRLVRTFSADTTGKVTDKEKAEAKELASLMEPFTAKLAVTVSEPGAEIAADDEVIGTSPLAEPVVVDITTRRVRAKKDGFREAVKDFPSGSSDVAVELVLTRVVHEGQLVVRAGANDAIAIDGQSVGTGTYRGTLASGGHTLRVTAPKMRPYQSEIVITDEQTREIAVSLEGESTRLPTWAWIAGGALVLGGLSVGGYFLFRGDQAYEGPSGNLPPGIVETSAPIRFR